MNSKMINRWSLARNPTPTPQGFPRATTPPRRALAMTICALLALLSIPLASAQRLDDAWFKLRFTGKGHTLDDAGRVEKVTVAAPVYLHFASTGTHAYSAQIWTKTEAGWVNLTTSDMQTLGANENIISHWGGTLHGPEGSSVHVYGTFFVTVKLDKFGAVASGLLDGGGEIDDGSLALMDGGATQYNHFYGTFTLKGTVVKASRLPFNP